MNFNCLICDISFNNSKNILEHLLKEHYIVIGDVEKILNLSK